MDLRDVAVHLQLSERMARMYVMRALLYCAASLEEDRAGADESDRGTRRSRRGA